MILIPRSSKGLLIKRLEKLLEEALYPGITTQTKDQVQRVLGLISASPDDINVLSRFQVIPERRCMQLTLEIVDVAQAPNQTRQ